MARITLLELNGLDGAGFTAALHNVFEHSPWIVHQVAGGRPFAGVKQLFAAMAAVVENLPLERQREFISVHPDLPNKAQRAAGLTADSEAEQGSAGLDGLSEAEYEAFERLNNAYRTNSAFPTSSARGVTPAIRSCATSPAGW